MKTLIVRIKREILVSRIFNKKVKLRKHQMIHRDQTNIYG